MTYIAYEGECRDAVQIFALRMFSHAILPWVRLIDLGLAELRNVRDSVAPRSYVDSSGQLRHRTENCHKFQSIA